MQVQVRCNQADPSDLRARAELSTLECLLELFVSGADLEHFVEFDHAEQLIKFACNIRKNDFHLPACGAAAGVYEHANAHAAHERDLFHVNYKPLVAANVSECFLERLRNDA